jgi:hypothetical protein
MTYHRVTLEDPCPRKHATAGQDALVSLHATRRERARASKFVRL